jgi:hypothetical protein
MKINAVTKAATAAFVPLPHEGRQHFILDGNESDYAQQMVYRNMSCTCMIYKLMTTLTITFRIATFRQSKRQQWIFLMRTIHPCPRCLPYLWLAASLFVTLLTATSALTLVRLVEVNKGGKGGVGGEGD